MRCGHAQERLTGYVALSRHDGTRTTAPSLKVRLIRRATFLPHYVAALPGRGGQQLDQRIGAQPEPYRRFGVSVFGIRPFAGTAVILGNSHKPLLEACKRGRDVGRQQGTWHRAAMAHHLEQGYRNPAKHGDVAPCLAAKCDQHLLVPVGARAKDPRPGRTARQSEAKISGAEESDHPDDDQVNRDDIVQQPGHDKNEDPGDQRYQGAKAQGDVHGCVLSLMRGDLP